MKPQFTRQSRRPLSPQSYQAAARMLRRAADRLETSCTPVTSQEKRRLTMIIHSLNRSVKHLRDRHDRLTLVVDPQLSCTHDLRR